MAVIVTESDIVSEEAIVPFASMFQANHAGIDIRGAVCDQIEHYPL
jgi:hypothetical protein